MVYITSLVIICLGQLCLAQVATLPADEGRNGDAFPLHDQAKPGSPFPTVLAGPLPTLTWSGAWGCSTYPPPKALCQDKGLPVPRPHSGVT